MADYCHEVKCHNVLPCPTHSASVPRSCQGIINGMPGPNQQKKGYVIVGGISAWNEADEPAYLVVGDQRVAIVAEEGGDYMARDVQLTAGRNAGQILLKRGSAIPASIDVETVY